MPRLFGTNFVPSPVFWSSILGPYSRSSGDTVAAGPKAAVLGDRRSVGTSAVPIAPQEPDRLTMTVFNVGPSAVYIGPSGVTTGTGTAIASGAGLVLASGDANLTGEWFALTASGLADVRVMWSV